uniref:Uncharacterized protein n=1 Tax=Myoviridae sp. ctPuP5 TaxID=2823543 RepID=A0A8S5L9R9_9CAUD|nr:MAG TPA: hypothetical protein [Myoviridae sp. ctPuP5]
MFTFHNIICFNCLCKCSAYFRNYQILSDFLIFFHT